MAKRSSPPERRPQNSSPRSTFEQVPTDATKRLKAWGSFGGRKCRLTQTLPEGFCVRFIAEREPAPVEDRERTERKFSI